MKRNRRRRHGHAHLSRVWVVRDPGLHSTLADILFSVDPSSADMENYVRGGLQGAWAKEGHDLYHSKAEATREAKRRLEARGPRKPYTEAAEYRGHARRPVQMFAAYPTDRNKTREVTSVTRHATAPGVYPDLFDEIEREKRRRG